MDINGKEIDLTQVLPLKVKDWRELEKHGITLAKLQAESVDHIARFVRYCAGKGNPEITHDDINEMTLDELVDACNDFLPKSEAKQADFT